MMIVSHKVKQLWPVILCGALLMLLLALLISITWGVATISLHDIVQWFMGKGDAQVHLILYEIRLPRALLALSIGALLASCGAVTQGLFRNPLADPSLIGVSAGAAMGASIVIVLLNHVSWNFWGLSLVSLGAFIGGILAVALVYRMATGPSGTSVATMLLAGIAITFLAGSISSLLEFLADNEMLKRISLWRMGGLDNADYPRVFISSLICIIILLVLSCYSDALNAFLLGESEARHLGIDVVKVKIILIVCVAAGIGISVALAGTIAFVGLVVPHMVRLCIGPDHRFLIPLSACLGAILLILADTLSRIVLSPTELPVGLMTTCIGAPVFISLLRRRHQYGMQ